VWSDAPIRSTGRPVTLTRAASAVAAVVLLAACGSSTTSSTRASPDYQLALAQCMRSHGVSNFPDPARGPSGEAFAVSRPPDSSSVTVDGTTFSGPAFQSAVATCRLFGRRRGGPPLRGT
jgi:hypothetical protein